MVLKMTHNTLKLYLLVSILIGFPLWNLKAQSSRLQFADKQFELANYRIAADEYSIGYEVKQDYATARKAAKSLDAILAFSESYEWWKKVIGYSAATKEDFAALVKSGYRSLENYDPANDLSGSPYSMADFEEFSKLATVTPISHRIYQLKSIEPINSNSSEYSIIESLSGIQYFSSNRGSGGQSKKSSLRLDAKGNSFNPSYFKSDGRNYYNIYSKDSDGEVKKLNVEGYEVYHLTEPQFLNDILIFTATPNTLNKNNQVIYPGIFYGVFDAISNTVKDIKPFPYNQTNSFAVISPKVDPEEKRLYFSSNRPGGLGGYDLYYSTWDDEMSFDEPVNLGTNINSEGNERDGFRYGNEFYFASDRKGGFGGLDVYTTPLERNDFGRVSNMGQPINSVADDFGFVKYGVAEAYLASDRVGGKGFDDLYKVSWTDRRLKIMVVDASGNSIKAGTSLQLIDGTKNIDITSVGENELLDLTKKGNPYTFLATRSGFFNQKLTATLVNEQEEILIKMAEIPYGLEVFQSVIYYDLDKDFLTESDKEKLDELSSYMAKHPELNLVIESHTDSRASDKYNQQLSERRANAVVKYLGEIGISGNRVSSSWFSESRLVNECVDGEPCPAPKHQLNRRTELKLVAFPEAGARYELPIGSNGNDFYSRDLSKKWFLGN